MGFAIRNVDPDILPEATGSHTHGTAVTGAQRMVFVSGQVPWDREAVVPPGFEEQCRRTWRNVLAVLSEADMDVRNPAKVTTYLSDRRYREANGRIRQEVLGEHRPAPTIIITDIHSPDWLLEIEAIAVE